jgi:hypothetical protein
VNHWAFVTAAYVVFAIGMLGLALQSWRAMVRAEAAAEGLKRK